MKTLTFYLSLSKDARKQSPRLIYEKIKKILIDFKNSSKNEISLDQFKPFADYAISNTLIYKNLIKCLVLIGPVNPTDEQHRWIVGIYPPEIPLIDKIFHTRKLTETTEMYTSVVQKLEEHLVTQGCITSVERYIEKN